MRERLKEKVEKEHGVKLSFMPFFVKAACMALKAYPTVNAQIDGDSIVYKHYVNMGIAVASDAGLVVPNVKDADRKGMLEVSRDIAAIAKRARDGKLTMDDLTGGTFTITNGGVFGSLVSTPIINFPQVGILGLHKTQDRPVAINGKVEIRPMMYVALSYDHRIIDGQQAVLFLVRVKELMEDPASMLSTESRSRRQVRRLSRARLVFGRFDSPAHSVMSTSASPILRHAPRAIHRLTSSSLAADPAGTSPRFAPHSSA